MWGHNVVSKIGIGLGLSCTDELSTFVSFCGKVKTDSAGISR